MSGEFLIGILNLECIRRGRYFAKSFRTGRSERAKQEISWNNMESSERVSGIFFKIAASINDAVWLNYCMFEKK